MAATGVAQLKAMREDFESMPPELRSRLLSMLCQSGVESPEWWWDVLVGDRDPIYRDWESLQKETPTEQRRRPPAAGGLLVSCP